MSNWWDWPMVILVSIGIVVVSYWIERRRNRR